VKLDLSFAVAFPPRSSKDFSRAILLPTQRKTRRKAAVARYEQRVYVERGVARWSTKAEPSNAAWRISMRSAILRSLVIIKRSVRVGPDRPRCARTGALAAGRQSSESDLKTCDHLRLLGRCMSQALAISVHIYALANTSERAITKVIALVVSEISVDHYMATGADDPTWQQGCIVP